MSYSRLRFVMNKITQLLLCCIASSLLADDLVVHLHTDKEPKLGVYVAQSKPSDSQYHKTLTETLFFDLTQNGKSKIIGVDDNKQTLAYQKDPSEAFQVGAWRSFGAHFVVVPQIESNLLTLKVFDVSTASLKTLHPIPLTHDLAKDMRAIHKASDTLYRIMHGGEGIASKRILYSFQPKVDTEESGLWNSEIWEMDYDGKNARQVTTENHYSITPAFIPDPSRPDNYSFLYVTYKQGPPRIYIAERNNPRGKPCIPLRGNQLLPCISPKRDKIAFISDASGRADLFIQPFHPDRGIYGKPVQIFSAADSVQASPSFNPDGTQIAFVSDKSGSPSIYIVDLRELAKTRRTPDPRLITKKNRDNSAPSWSADGKKIAYSAKINGVRQIWIYDIETNEERQITMGMGNKENPSFAPDSLHLVYNTTSPTYDIFLLNIDNPEPIRLTDGPGIKHYPVFEP